MAGNVGGEAGDRGSRRVGRRRHRPQDRHADSGPDRDACARVSPSVPCPRPGRRGARASEALVGSRPRWTRAYGTCMWRRPGPRAARSPRPPGPPPHARRGISLPGLRIPAGSSSVLIARRMSMPRSPISALSHGAWSTPTPWWWVMVPPPATIASVAADFTARHCAIGSARLCRDEGEVERGARGIHVRDVAHDDSPPAVDLKRRPDRRCDLGVQGLEAVPRRRGLEGVDEDVPAHQLVAQIGPGEAALLPGPGDPARQAPRRSPGQHPLADGLSVLEGGGVRALPDQDDEHRLASPRARP